MLQGKSPILHCVDKPGRFAQNAPLRADASDQEKFAARQRFLTALPLAVEILQTGQSTRDRPRVAR
jgi:hypothetical protein